MAVIEEDQPSLFVTHIRAKTLRPSLQLNLVIRHTAIKYSRSVIFIPKRLSLGEILPFGNIFLDRRFTTRYVPVR